jgi:predicted nucleic acid-binding protein
MYASPALIKVRKFYDALVIAAAADAGCSVLLTGDPQHGRKFGGVSVENPFLEET